MLDQWDPAISCTIFPLTLIFSIYLVSKLFIAYPLDMCKATIEVRIFFSMYYHYVGSADQTDRRVSSYILLLKSYNHVDREPEEDGLSCSSAVICNLCR